MLCKLYGGKFCARVLREGQKDALNYSVHRFGFKLVDFTKK